MSGSKKRRNSENSELAITKIVKEQIKNNIQDLIEAGFQRLWKNKIRDECKLLEEREAATIKQEIAMLKHDMCNLSVKTDEILGSLAYQSAEYDDHSIKISVTDKLTEKNAKTVTSLQEEIQDIKIQQHLAINHLDDLEQYGRRENSEIHGIPEMNNESTNEIVKSVAKALNVDLDESHISTSHRIAQPKSDRQQQRKPNQSPPIIVRFPNRDKRNEIFRKKKMLRSNPSINSTFGNVYVNITENLTKRRRTLFNTATIN